MINVAETHCPTLESSISHLEVDPAPLILKLAPGKAVYVGTGAIGFTTVAADDTKGSGIFGRTRISPVEDPMRLLTGFPFAIAKSAARAKVVS